MSTHVSVVWNTLEIIVNIQYAIHSLRMTLNLYVQVMANVLTQISAYVMMGGQVINVQSIPVMVSSIVILVSVLVMVTVKDQINVFVMKLSKVMIAQFLHVQVLHLILVLSVQEMESVLPRINANVMKDIREIIVIYQFAMKYLQQMEMYVVDQREVFVKDPINVNVILVIVALNVKIPRVKVYHPMIPMFVMEEENVSPIINVNVRVIIQDQTVK